MVRRPSWEEDTKLLKKCFAFYETPISVPSWQDSTETLLGYEFI
jgi:hypothetical protein